MYLDPASLLVGALVGAFAFYVVMLMAGYRDLARRYREAVGAARNKAGR